MIDHRDLEPYLGATLTGVLVGIGSIVLNFGNDTSVTLMGEFTVTREAIVSRGTAERPDTALYLLRALNSSVSQAGSDNEHLLWLQMTNGDRVAALADRSGYEVVNLLNGIDIITA
jgi:hypothetical protein